VRRVHASAADAVCAASGTSGRGRSTGSRSRKNASESVTRSSAGPDCVEQAARPLVGEPVEVGRSGGLVPGAPAQHAVGAVAEPVEQDEDDRKHGRRLNHTQGRPNPAFGIASSGRYRKRRLLTSRRSRRTPAPLTPSGAEL